MNERENHDLCTRKFIDLANSLKDEGHPVQLVSAALLAASGIYLTFATAGNAGALEPSGWTRRWPCSAGTSNTSRLARKASWVVLSIDAAGWWALQDSNLRPSDYESPALTN